jgi:hypothetical protein
MKPAYAYSLYYTYVLSRFNLNAHYNVKRDKWLLGLNEADSVFSITQLLSVDL